MTGSLFARHDDLDERELRVLLTAVMDGGDLRATSRVTEAGVRATWEAVVGGDFGPGIQGRAAQIDVGQVVHAGRVLGARFVIPGDDEWPTPLDDLGLVDSHVEGRGGVPIGLWLRGPGHLRELCARSVAVVGARACTPYGERVSHDLGFDLAKLEVTVVSGLAMGIDVAAHRGALVADGATIAVLASGVDVAYPRSNEPVYRRLAETQLVVSEVRPGANPTKVGFLARNRIIAALSRGTVLVEAALRSGARNTVNWASSLGRPVMAVPGSIESAWSQGPHAAIRDQQATLVTGAAEVCEVIAPMGSDTLAAARGVRRPVDDLDPVTLAVYEALPTSGTRTVGEVAIGAGVAVSACLAALCRLESTGLAELDPAGWRLGRG